MRRKQRQEALLCRGQARCPASLRLGKRVRPSVELVLELHEHTESRADAEDVAHPSQERSSSVRVGECEADAYELEESVGGKPRHRGGRVRKELVCALERSRRLGKIASQGGEIMGGTPEEFARLIRSESEKWAPVIQRTGAKVD